MHKKIIPTYSTPVKEKFINYIMKEGKKSVARRIFDDAMAIIREKGHKQPEKVFEEALENIKPSMEVKPKRIGEGVYQVPMPVTPTRQFALACRWLLKYTRDKKGTAMEVRLANELLAAHQNTGDAIKKKNDVLKMAEANKAFAHLARY